MGEWNGVRCCYGGLEVVFEGKFLFFLWKCCIVEIDLI